MRSISKEHLTWDVGIGRHYVKSSLPSTSGVEHRGYPLAVTSPVVDDVGMGVERSDEQRECNCR